MAIAPFKTEPVTEQLVQLLLSDLNEFWKAGGVLVADGDIVEALKKYPVTAITFEASLSKLQKAKSFIVMSREKECQKVRQLQRSHDTALIYSFTYQILPAGGVKQLDEAVLAARKADEAPILYMAPYGGETPYILRAMHNANMDVPVKVLSGEVLLWINELADFRFIRFVANLRRFGAHKDRPWFVESRELLALMQAGQLLPAQVSHWLEKDEIQVVYINRRNKCEQAVMLSLMEPRGMSSLWDVSRREIRGMKAPVYNFDALHEMVQKLVLEEAELECVLTYGTNVKMLTLEELVDSQVAALEALAISLSQPMNKKMTIQDYRGRYKEVDGLLEQVSQLRADMIEHLGLVKNAAGSYTIETSGR